MPPDSQTFDLFEDNSLPPGFRYQSEFLSREEEGSLLQHIQVLPVRDFENGTSSGKMRHPLLSNYPTSLVLKRAELVGTLRSRLQ